MGQEFAHKHIIQYVSDEDMFSKVILNREFMFTPLYNEEFVNFLNIFYASYMIGDKSKFAEVKLKDTEEVENRWKEIRYSPEFKAFLDKYFTGYISVNIKHKTIYESIRSYVTEIITKTPNLEELVKDEAEFPKFSDYIFTKVFEYFPSMRLTSGENYLRVKEIYSDLMIALGEFFTMFMNNVDPYNNELTGKMKMQDLVNIINYYCDENYTIGSFYEASRKAVMYRAVSEREILLNPEKARLLGGKPNLDTYLGVMFFNDPTKYKKLRELRDVYVSDQNKISRIESIIDESLSKVLTEGKINHKQANEISEMLVQLQKEKIQAGLSDEIKDIDVQSIIQVDYTYDEIIKYVKQFRQYLAKGKLKKPNFPYHIRIKEKLIEEKPVNVDYAQKDDAEEDDTGMVQEDAQEDEEERGMFREDDFYGDEPRVGAEEDDVYRQEEEEYEDVF